MRKVKAKKYARKSAETDADDFELTKAQLRELQRRIADTEDPTRYLIKSTLSPTFVLYYNVTEDMYSWKDASYATLFKRREAALAIQRLLKGGAQVVRCTTRLRKGQRIPVLATLKSTKRRPRKKSSRPNSSIRVFEKRKG